MIRRAVQALSCLVMLTVLNAVGRDIIEYTEYNSENE